MPGRKGGCQKQTKTFQIVQGGEQKMKKAAKTGRRMLCPSYHSGGKCDLALRQGHFAPPKRGKNGYSFARALTIGYLGPGAQRDLRSRCGPALGGHALQRGGSVPVRRRT